MRADGQYNVQSPASQAARSTGRAQVLGVYGGRRSVWRSVQSGSQDYGAGVNGGWVWGREVSVAFSAQLSGSLDYERDVSAGCVQGRELFSRQGSKEGVCIVESSGWQGNWE